MGRGKRWELRCSHTHALLHGMQAQHQAGQRAQGEAPDRGEGRAPAAVEWGAAAAAPRPPAPSTHAPFNRLSMKPLSSGASTLTMGDEGREE